MPIDPSISLQYKPPQLMTPADALSLAALVQKTQFENMQYAQATKDAQNTALIQQIVNGPDSVDPETGVYTLDTIRKMGKVDWQIGQKAAGQREHELISMRQLQSQFTQDQLNQMNIGEKLKKSQNDVLNDAVSAGMAAEQAGASPEIIEQKFRTGYKGALEMQQASGTTGYPPKWYENLANSPITYEQAKSMVTTPQQMRKEESEARSAAIREETPFIKEMRAAGIEPESPKGKALLREHLAKANAPTAVMIGQQPLPAGALESAAAQAATGQPLSQVVPGYGQAAASKRELVRQEAIKQIIAENPTFSQADAGRELARRSTEFIAGRRSVVLLTTMLGTTRQAVKQLDFNVAKAKELMHGMTSSDLSPIINEVIRGAERWTGDPKYASLFFYMHATAMESARILSSATASVAQLHAKAAEEAEKWANINLTPAMFDEVAQAMRDEGHFRIKSYTDAIREQSIGGGTPAQASQYQGPKPNPNTATATNPQTGQRMITHDRGKTWQPIP